MIRFVQRALSYTAQLSQSQFLDSDLTYDATIRNLDQVRRTHEDIPWRMIIATRNRLIHGYLGIDTDTLWSIITQDLPTLLPRLQQLAGRVDPEGS